jgi:hypothetical protein
MAWAILARTQPVLRRLAGEGTSAFSCFAALHQATGASGNRIASFPSVITRVDKVLRLPRLILGDNDSQGPALAYGGEQRRRRRRAVPAPAREAMSPLGDRRATLGGSPLGEQVLQHARWTKPLPVLRLLHNPLQLREIGCVWVRQRR